MRAFWALAVAEPALSDVGAVLERLGSAGLGPVRWARPETVHATLHFFASLPEDRIDGAVAAVRDAAASVAPFTVRPAGLGAFPDRGVPRVLWLGAEDGAPELIRLAGAVEANLAARGFPVEDRPFRAHVTLGRARPPWNAEQRRAWAVQVSTGARLHAFTADHLTLFQSRPGPGGAVYTVLSEAPFASASVRDAPGGAGQAPER